MLVYVCAHILKLFLFTGLTVNKTVRDFFRGVYACICMHTYFDIISIYWSDTSLVGLLP